MDNLEKEESYINREKEESYINRLVGLG